MLPVGILTFESHLFQYDQIRYGFENDFFECYCTPKIHIELTSFAFVNTYQLNEYLLWFIREFDIWKQMHSFEEKETTTARFCSQIFRVFPLKDRLKCKEKHRVGFKKWPPYSIRIRDFLQFDHTLWDMIKYTKQIYSSQD